MEGVAVRVTDEDALHEVAEAFVAKYGEVWRFEVRDGAFNHGSEDPAAVFRIEATKVLAFALARLADEAERPRLWPLIGQRVPEVRDARARRGHAAPDHRLPAACTVAATRIG